MWVKCYIISLLDRKRGARRPSGIDEFDMFPRGANTCTSTPVNLHTTLRFEDGPFSRRRAGGPRRVPPDS